MADREQFFKEIKHDPELVDLLRADTTNYKENLMIANWLGIQIIYTCTNAACGEDHAVLPDFYHDEVLNAMVLDNLLKQFRAIIQHDYVRFERTLGRYYEGRGDRKTAICEAALEVINETESVASPSSRTVTAEERKADELAREADRRISDGEV